MGRVGILLLTGLLLLNSGCETYPSPKELKKKFFNTINTDDIDKIQSHLYGGKVGEIFETGNPVSKDENQIAPKVGFVKEAGINPKEWIVTNIAILHSPDDGKTWNTLLFLSSENLKKILKKGSNAYIYLSSLSLGNGRHIIDKIIDRSKTGWHIEFAQIGDEYLGKELIILCTKGYFNVNIFSFNGGKSWQIGMGADDNPMTLQTHDGGKTWIFAKYIFHEDLWSHRVK